MLFTARTRLKQVVRVAGTAASEGGTWGHLVATGKIPLGGILNGLGGIKHPIGGVLGDGTEIGPAGLAGLSPAQVRAWVRRQTHARVVRQLEARTLASRAACAERAAELTTTVADVVAYREANGLSQRDLAALVGCSRGAVAACELGQRLGLVVREWVQAQTRALAPARGATK